MRWVSFGWVSFIIKWLHDSFIKIYWIRILICCRTTILLRVKVLRTTIIVLCRLWIIDYLYRINVWEHFRCFTNVKRLPIRVFITLHYLKSIDVSDLKISLNLLYSWAKSSILMIRLALLIILLLLLLLLRARADRASLLRPLIRLLLFFLLLLLVVIVGGGLRRLGISGWPSQTNFRILMLS